MKCECFTFKKHLICWGMVAMAMLSMTGCRTLFGWDIHAPGILSVDAYQKIQPMNARIALYLPKEVLTYQSTDKGGALADPQTYHVGEAYVPMLIEGFQQGFSEFVFMEVEPTPAVMKQYAIPYLAVVRIKSFNNRVNLKGQGLLLVTETVVFDGDFQPLARFESKGSSDAQKIFAKKGGPEVNLNAALENNILAIVQYIQDGIRTGQWKEYVNS